MLSIDFTKELIGLKDIIVKNVVRRNRITEIEIEVERKAQRCPCCGTATRTIHDYRWQQIKDIPSFGKHVIINLHKRRYRCPHCGKRFIEEVDFLPSYHRMTNRLAAYVLAELAKECSFTSVSKRVNLSVSTVIRIFDFVNYGTPVLPEVLSIDEFKGNTGFDKYQVIITDPVTGRVLDILPSRYAYKLINYFKPMDRDNVKFFVSDMWGTYKDLSKTFFKNAVPIIDKYHIVRQVVWAFEAVRKQEQKKFGKSHRIYFKRSRTLLIRKYDYLKEEEKQQVNVMLSTSVNLSSAYFLKEKFLKLPKPVAKQKLKLFYMNGLLQLLVPDCLSLCLVQKLIQIGQSQYSIPLISIIQTLLPRVAITKSRFLSVTLMVIAILDALETAFCICFTTAI